MDLRFDAIEALRDALATVPGVVTCKIGLERGIPPDDYPLIRIVPSESSEGDVVGSVTHQLVVYFGRPIHQFEGGLEELYRATVEMTGQIMTAAAQVPGVSVQFNGLMWDQDRPDAYKMTALDVTLTA